MCHYFLTPTRGYIAHVGGSRVYLIRQEKYSS